MAKKLALSVAALLVLIVAAAFIILPSGEPSRAADRAGSLPAQEAPRPVETAAASPPIAPPADPVRTTFDLIMDHFYRAPDPARLLSDGWQGATGALSRAGYRGALPPPPALPADRALAWTRFAAAYQELALLSPESLARADLDFAAAGAMAGSLDERHTAFLRPAAYQSTLADLAGERDTVGIGAIIRQRSPWLVTDLAAGGPAERAGMRRGDVIVAVNGADAGRVSRAELNRALAGEKDTMVTVSVNRPNDGRYDLNIGRALVSFPDLQARVLPDGVGYIRLRSFSAFIDAPDGRPNVIRELDRALEQFEAAGVTAWVLDLRDNTGGFVFTAAELAGRFLGDGRVARVSTERGDRGEHGPAGRPFRVQRPLAVLINGRSASSSEMLASALREHERAVLVGDRSAGALAGALLFALPGGAGIQIAVEEVRTGRDNIAVDEVGIIPDIIAADTRVDADYATGRDPQLAAAISAARGRPASSPPVIEFTGQLSEAALRALAAPYLPAAEEAPATPLIPSARVLGDLALTYPNQWVNNLGPVLGPAGLARTVHERGWLGSYARYYGQVPGLNGPYFGVMIDVYSAPAGAYAAMNSNDAPRLQRETPVPAQLGDGAVAYTGAWVAAGSASLMWRSGRVVVTVSYAAVPGQESLEPVLALARLIDARLTRTPVPALEPATAR